MKDGDEQTRVQETGEEVEQDVKVCPRWWWRRRRWHIGSWRKVSRGIKQPLIKDGSFRLAE